MLEGVCVCLGVCLLRLVGLVIDVQQVGLGAGGRLAVRDQAGGCHVLAHCGQCPRLQRDAAVARQLLDRLAGRVYASAWRGVATMIVARGGC